MILLPPINVPRVGLADGSAILTASNVSSDDNPQWIGGSYTTGDLVRMTRTGSPNDDGQWRDYRAKLTGALDKPGPNANPTHWADLGPVNRFRMFKQDQDNEFASEVNPAMPSESANSSTDITSSLTPGQAVDAISFHSVVGDSIRVQVYDLDNSPASEEYDTTKSLLTNGLQTQFNSAFLDLPSAVTNPRIDITIAANGSETTKCGLCAFGTQIDLGVTLIGGSIGIRDYSEKSISTDGVITITAGSASRFIDFDVHVTSAAQRSYVQRQISRYNAQAVVWVGDPDKSESIIYGFFQDFEIVIPDPYYGTCSIRIEGL